MENDVHFNGLETAFINKMNSKIGLYYSTDKEMRNLSGC
jgi:hypothetical protein